MYMVNKMKKTIHTVGTNKKSNIKIVTPENPNTRPHTFLAWYRHFNTMWRG